VLPSKLSEQEEEEEDHLLAWERMGEWGNNKVGASGGRVSADLLGGKTKERELNFNLILKKKIRFYPKHKGSVILGI
jgi:hypothetical protein